MANSQLPMVDTKKDQWWRIGCALQLTNNEIRQLADGYNSINLIQILGRTKSLDLIDTGYAVDENCQSFCHLNFDAKIKLNIPLSDCTEPTHEVWWLIGIETKLTHLEHEKLNNGTFTDRDFINHINNCGFITIAGSAHAPNVDFNDNTVDLMGYFEETIYIQYQ